MEKILIYLIENGIDKVIIGFISSFLIFKLKSNYDRRNFNNDIANEKLSEVINPLIYKMRMVDFEQYIFDDEASLMLKSKGHLLSPSLYNGYIDLAIKEKELKNSF